MIMDSNENSKMSSNSTIDIVQSLMQDAFESSYEKMDFLNEQTASKVSGKDNDSSRSEFERLLTEGVVNGSGNIVDGLSDETINLLKKTTEELDKGSTHISSKSDEKMEDVISADDSEDLNLTLDDSNTSIEAAKEGDNTSTSRSELNKQDSDQTTQEHSDNDSQESSVSKEMPNGMIQITNVISQTSIAENQSSQTNEKSQNVSIAETATTESLEKMLESLDGPAEPEIVESNGNRNSSSRQDSLLMMNAIVDNAAAVGKASSSLDESSYQDVEIKVEVESEEEITVTETFCEGQLDRENDTRYFKMFECKGLSIDLHDIIKTESSRDAKAGLYKPAERKSIDVIRKEYKTKAMQDYIRKVNRMKLPDDNYNNRTAYRKKNIPAPLYTPMVSINLLNTKDAPHIIQYIKTPQFTKNLTTNKNAYNKSYTPKSKMNLSNTKKTYSKSYTPKSKTPNSKTPNSKTPKAPINKSLKSQYSSTRKKSSPKSSNKVRTPQKMKVKFSFQKKNQQDYLDDDSNYYDVDDDKDEDYEPSKTATNYVCNDCREYFETQAELNVHKRMEHNESSKYTSWNTAVKTVSKGKRAKIPIKNRETKPVYVKSDSRKSRGTLPVYFKSDQYRIDGINGMRKTRGFKLSQRIANLNQSDMIKGAELVYNNNPYYNYELGKNITDLEMYHHMVKKYTIKAAKLCIGTSRFSSFYQLAKSPTDSLRAKITTVREERGHVLITSPLLHW